MTMFSMKARLLASSLFSGVALAAAAAGPAAAQAAAAQDPGLASDSAVTEIVVTGSRIPQTNMISVSPVQAVGGQEFQLQGRPNTIELLNTLPQVNQLGNSTLSSTSNPLSTPGGVATLDLRGLGPQRTLVLVDGRRLGIGDPSTANTNPSPDINQIPSQLIQRVEVLTGGASATYGSDAVAGVVNFIMKRDFEGIQLDVQAGTNQHNNHNEIVGPLQDARNIPHAKDKVWDGQSYDASLLVGVNGADGKSNITGYFTYHKQQPVRYSRRDFANCQVNVTVTATSSTPACAGSSNSNIFYSGTGAPGQFAVLGNQFIPYSASANTNPPPLFNSNPYEYLLHDNKRYTAGLFARYEINENAELYSDFAYVNDKTTTQVAPSGLFQGSGVTENTGFLVNCNNPLLSAQQAATICTPAQIAAGQSVDLIIGRRNVEGGGRQSIYEHENYRAVIGLRGVIAGPWRYDVYAQRYHVSLFQQNLGYISLARTQNALQVVNRNGQAACISGGSCVPYNIFSDGGVTPAAIDYLSSSGSQRGSTTQSIVSGSITGDLGEYGLKMPWANDGVGVAFGAEYRKENLQFRPDEASLSGDLSGFGGASTAVDENLSVKEFFGEVRIPLVEARPGFDQLLLEGGYRYSDYSSDVTANTFKVGLQWAPTPDMRFRGSFQRAIRAPNIIELFLPPSVTNTSDVSEDPCSGSATAPATATFQQCANTGVTAAQYGNGGSTNLIAQCPSGQCSLLNAGNPSLRAERANTFSVGATFRPRFIPGFSASVDYYTIKIKDQIGSIPLDITLDNCLNTGDPLYCSLIRRAPNGILFGTAVGSAGYISGQVVNIGQVTASGLDFQAAYNLPVGDYGSIAFSYNGSYLMDNKTIPLPGEPEYDCAGLFGPTCDGVFPKYRHALRATWSSPWRVQLSAQWRHMSAVKLETNTDDPTLGNGRFNSFNARLGSRDYIDLTAVYRLNDMFSFRAGVNNVFDVDPPLVSSLIAGTGTPNTYGAYDLLGRRMFVGVTANF
jgi:outer membrane receptor protein involved in Fe transport